MNVEDWAEVRRLHRAEGVPIKEIAQRLGVARNTVRAALASDRPPKYERARRGSVSDAYEPQVRALLAQWPRMPGPVIVQPIGWPYSEGPLKKLLADRAVRPVVSRDTTPAPVGAGQARGPADAGGDVGVLPVPVGDDDPLAPGRRHLVRDVAADQRVSALIGPADAAGATPRSGSPGGRCPPSATGWTQSRSAAAVGPTPVAGPATRHLMAGTAPSRHRARTPRDSPRRVDDPDHGRRPRILEGRRPNRPQAAADPVPQEHGHDRRPAVRGH